MSHSVTNWRNKNLAPYSVRDDLFTYDLEYCYYIVRATGVNLAPRSQTLLAKIEFSLLHIPPNCMRPGPLGIFSNSGVHWRQRTWRSEPEELINQYNARWQNLMAPPSLWLPTSALALQWKNTFLLYLQFFAISLETSVNLADCPARHSASPNCSRMHPGPPCNLAILVYTGT